LLVGDYLFLEKFAYGYSRYSFPFGFPPFSGRIPAGGPQRGDVVVFKMPNTNSPDYMKDFIKRVIGLPGDRIQMVNGQLYLEGKAVFLFFSNDGNLWEVWKWPWTVRFSRLFTLID